MNLRIPRKITTEERRRIGSNSKSSSSKYSYHSLRINSENKIGRNNRSDTPKTLSKKRNNWLHHIPAYIAIFIVIVSIMYSVTLSTKPTVTVIGETSQTVMQNNSVYEKYAQHILDSSILNKTKLTINTSNIASQIKQKFSELNGVSVVIPLLGHQPQLEITPAKSIFVLVNKQAQYVINQQGIAVVKWDNGYDHIKLPQVIDITGFNVVIGQQALSATSVKFIKTVLDQFNAKGINIDSMTLSTTPYELDVNEKGQHYIIKFNLLTDPLYATGTYFSTLKLFNSSNPLPTQYIDIRIPGRSYYK